MDAHQVTDIFLERGLISPEQREEFVQMAATGESPIEQLLVDYQVIDEEGFIHVIADSMGVEAYNLNEFQPDTTTLTLIPAGLARLHGAMPIMGTGNTIFVALADPLNPQTIEDLRFALGREITPMIAFPKRVSSLITEHYGSAVTNFEDILAQLGGGTDINKSVAYCEKFIRDPRKTLFILITDLFEGGNEAQLVRRLGHMAASGVRAICLLALSDNGNPSYDENLARKLAALGIPCFACTPAKLPDLVEGALRGADLTKLATERKPKT